MVISCKPRFDANSEQVGRGDRGGEREERDEQQEHQVQPHEVGVGGLDESGEVAVGDPDPADEGEADEVAQVPGPVMFESLQQCFVAGRHVQFQDEQGDGDREDAVGEGLQTVGGQVAAVGALAVGRRGAGDGRSAQFPPY